MKRGCLIKGSASFFDAHAKKAILFRTAFSIFIVVFNLTSVTIINRSQSQIVNRKS